jgi:streptogramin lyase
MNDRLPVLTVTLVLRQVVAMLAAVWLDALLSPASAQVIREYPLPQGRSLPWGITGGPDGNIWFTEAVGNKIGRISPRVSVDSF